MVSDPALCQICECPLQAAGKFRINASNFVKQAIRHSLESPQKFSAVELSNQRAFELSGQPAWQLIHAAPVSGRKTVPNASEGKRVVADATNHVFGLP